MGVKSLKISILTAVFLLPGTAFALIGSSTNYNLDVADLTGTGFSATSTSYATIGITDENFNASSVSYELCGGLPNEVWGCGVVPPPPPPPGGGGPIAGGRVEPEEEIIIIPEEPEEEIPEHIIFPWDALKPEEIVPEVPEIKPEPPKVMPEIQPVIQEPGPPEEIVHPYTEGFLCEDIACYGAAKVLLRPAAPETVTVLQYPIALYVLGLLLAIIAALLIHRVDSRKKLYNRA